MNLTFIHGVEKNPMHACMQFNGCRGIIYIYIYKHPVAI